MTQKPNLSKLPLGRYACPSCGLEALLTPPSCTRLHCARCDCPLDRVGDLPAPKGKRRTFNRWAGKWAGGETPERKTI